MPEYLFRFIRDNYSQFNKRQEWDVGTIRAYILRQTGGSLQEMAEKDLTTLIDTIISDKLTRQMLMS